MHKSIYASFIVATVSVSAFAASVFFTEPDTGVATTIVGEPAGDAFGWVAENLGDINGDGVGDLITSAPFHVTAGALTGEVYVYSGADGSLLNKITGNPGELAGYGASSVGDVNNDGINDYGFGTFVRAAVYSGADHSLLHEWISPGERFGFDINSAGDVDGDGHSDVIVGAEFANSNGAASGRVAVYSGASGSLLWEFAGLAADDRLGRGVGPVGDVNDDGIPDVVASAPGGGHKGRGAAYVLSGDGSGIIHTLLPVGLPSIIPAGSPRTFGTFGEFHTAGGGDVNCDGYPDIYVGDYAARRGNTNTGRSYVFSGRDGSRLHVFDAENNADGLGPGRIVDDIDGDGCADVFTAAYQYSEGENFAGRAYLYSGIDGSLIRVLTGSLADQYLGVDATGIDDVNGDGLPDLILTGVDFTNTFNGIVHVVLSQ